MKTITKPAGLAIAITIALAVSGSHAADRSDDWCRDAGWRGDDRYSHCEVRELTIAPRPLVEVDGRENGGVSIEGWDRSEVSIRARVQIWARGRAEAEELARSITIETGDAIRAEGPKRGAREGWSVSYRISVPRVTDLDLRAHNGGIAIAGVDGRIRFATTNGGVHLEDLAGDVRGETVNGGIDLDLTGATWNGDGLDVSTTNGGLSIAIPDGYSADLSVGTVNGGISLDFPVAVSGEIRRRLETRLGRGGSPVRVMTTNGGVRIHRP